MAVLGQVHALGSAGITSTVVVGVSDITEVYGIVVVDITSGAAVVGTAALAQTHALASTDLGSAISVGTATIGQGHTLTAVTVASGAATVGTSQIAQTHALGSTQITAGAAVVAASTIRQTHGLASTNLTGAAITFLPPGPRLRNLWALTASGITAGQPVLQSAALTEFYAARRRYVSVTLGADIQPVREWGTEVDVVVSTNTVVIEVDGTIVEVYDGANFAAADNANSATGAYIGQTKAE